MPKHSLYYSVLLPGICTRANTHTQARAQLHHTMCIFVGDSFLLPNHVHRFKRQNSFDSILILHLSKSNSIYIAFQSNHIYLYTFTRRAIGMERKEGILFACVCVYSCIHIPCLFLTRKFSFLVESFANEVSPLHCTQLFCNITLQHKMST